jgi:Ala-tRNA(Pro) deacylase
MTVSRKLKQFLDSERVRYETIAHSPAYTSQKTAAAAHVPGRELAKSVVVKVDGALALAVLPAPRQVDLARLKKALGARKVELAGEDEFRERFPECEVGAMPPFGNLYALPVYVAEELTADEVIAFNAGTHTELVRMAYADFARLVTPQVVEFATAAP